MCAATVQVCMPPCVGEASCEHNLARVMWFFCNHSPMKSHGESYVWAREAMDVRCNWVSMSAEWVHYEMWSKLLPLDNRYRGDLTQYKSRPVMEMLVTLHPQEPFYLNMRARVRPLSSPHNPISMPAYSLKGGCEREFCRGFRFSRGWFRAKSVAQTLPQLPHFR